MPGGRGLDARIDEDRFQAILEGSVTPGPGGSIYAEAMARVAALESARLPGIPHAARGRLARRIAALMDEPAGPDLWRVLGAWLGIGPWPRPRSQRLAAGALVIVLAGSGASATVGVTPLDAAARLAELGRSLIANLVPIADGSQLNSVAGSSPPPERALFPSGATPTSTVSVTATPDSTALPAATPTPGVLNPPAQQPVPGDANAVSTSTPAVPTATNTSVPQATPPSPTALPTSGAPSLPAPDSTQASGPGTPQPSTPTPTIPRTIPTPSSTPTATPTPPAVQTFQVSTAGSVTLRMEGTSLVVAGFTTAPGWIATVKPGSDVQVDFRSGKRGFRFTAELENGVIDAKTEELAEEDS